MFLYGFAIYLFVTSIFLFIALGFHEAGHIIYAKYHHLDYKILFVKGDLKIAAEWEVLGNRKVYGHMLGIIFGLPVIIVGGILYPTPIFLLVYAIACYDDIKETIKIIPGLSGLRS